MDYDVERSKQASEEVRKAFREIFPLACEHDLPWAACHIKDFLRERIRRQVQEGVFHFQSRVVRVLCEVSPPKTHIEDMARIVVEQAKKFEREFNDAREQRDARTECLREIAALLGRNFTDNDVGRQLLISEIEKRLAHNPKS